MMPVPVLEALRELSVVPYENLSKIVATRQRGGREHAMLLASDWLEQTLSAERIGDFLTGGTCFSLTYWLERRLRARGFTTAYLMGDKGKSKNIHCALRLDWAGRGYLLDPGYMIYEPLPLPAAGLTCSLWISPNQVRLEDVPGLKVWRLWSGPVNRVKQRFDFRRQPVSEAEFFRHWEASYAFPMMTYPVLNQNKDGTQFYLQKRNLLVRTPDASDMRKLNETEMKAVLNSHFGIPGDLAREALEIVAKGNPYFWD